jgi:peroxiredoxin
MRLRLSHMKSVIALLLLTLSVLVHAQDKPSADQYVTLPHEAMTQKLKTIDNKSLTLSDYPDAIIIINLFATWSPPCRTNLSDLIDLKKHYDKNPIIIIGMDWIENDRDLDQVIEFADQMKINFPVVWDTDNFSHMLVSVVNSRSVVPQTFIIDTHGRIRKHFSGFNPTMTPQLLRQALDDVAAHPDADKPAP